MGKRKRKLNDDQGFGVEKESEINFAESLKDKRSFKIYGVLLLLLAAILIISFFSYISNWKTDQSEVLKFADLWSGKLKVKNAFGALGAWLSHLFIYKGFGLTSFALSLPLMAWGINLVLEKKVYRLTSVLKNVICILFLGSIIFSFFTQKAIFPYGGKIGQAVHFFIQNVIGKVGFVLFLLAGVAAYIIWKFNPNLTSVKTKIAGWGNAEEKEQTNTELNINNPVDVKENFESKELELNTTSKTEQKAPLIYVEKPIQQPEIIETPFGLNLNNEKGFTTEITTFDNENENKTTAKKQKENKEATDLSLEIKQEEIAKSTIEENSVIENKGNINTLYDPALDLSNYKFPTLDLLENHGSEIIIQDANELENNKNQIINTLKNYDITIQKIFATIGPTVTLYEIVPAAGIRISKIKNLEDDIALSLSALGIRIIAPIPGKGTIGIEVPNVKKTVVSMKTLLSSEKFQKNNYSLPIALGKKIDNENFIVDLASMPHLLMAGATGQGKSVGLNAILVSLLYKKHPSQLKFVLVDPKKVELSIYKTIEKHFLAKLPGEDEPIITDTKKVVHTLNALCIEMDNRYDLLKEAGCRNLKEYNEKFVARKLNPEKGHQFLPFIVLVVDEFADLIMTAGKEVELPIARLAQLARAVGIHLIIATQRPSVNIITGTIKANFPARIAFKVSSKIDSRTILDAGGADQLIGKGDMLVSHNGELTRLQCAFVDTPEVDKICEFISKQQGYPMAFLLPEYEGENEKDGKNFDIEDKDPLFDDAARLIVSSQIGSTSLLQRKMKLGYNRAGRLMDQLEAAGVVGPNQGSKPREVYIKSEIDLSEMLNQ